MSKDRPLTDAQERALIELMRLTDAPQKIRDTRARWGMSNEWFPSSRFARNKATTLVLARLGLVETRAPTYGLEARITEAGRALLRSMGD